MSRAPRAGGERPAGRSVAIHAAVALALAAWTASAERSDAAPAPALGAAATTSAVSGDAAGSAMDQVAEPNGAGADASHLGRRALIERGMDEYMAGRFDLAATTFRELAQGAPRSAGAHLLVGMALHAAYELGGETDASLLNKAQIELALAARLNPRLRPDPQMFSPRLIALFDRAR